MSAAVAAPTDPAIPSWQLWTGRILSALPVLMMLFSASMKLGHSPAFMEAWTKFGFSEASATPIGLVEVACAVLYAIPKTRVLGAILVTGYLGGAIVTHVRAGQPFVAPLVLGVIAWAGLYLRDARVRALIPLVGR